MCCPNVRTYICFHVKRKHIYVHNANTVNPAQEVPNAIARQYDDLVDSRQALTHIVRRLIMSRVVDLYIYRQMVYIINGIHICTECRHDRTQHRQNPRRSKARELMVHQFCSSVTHDCVWFQLVVNVYDCCIICNSFANLETSCKRVWLTIYRCVRCDTRDHSYIYIYISHAHMRHNVSSGLVYVCVLYHVVLSRHHYIYIYTHGKSYC